MGGLYSLLSDCQVQLNAQLVYLHNVSCAHEHGTATPVEQCYDTRAATSDACPYPPGPALAAADSESQRRRTLSRASVTATRVAERRRWSGGQRLCTRHPALNEQEGPVPVHVGMTYNSSSRLSGAQQSQQTLSHHKRSSCSHTWNASAPIRQCDDGVEQYRERDDDLLGCNNARDRHCSPHTLTASAHTHSAPYHDYSQRGQMHTWRDGARACSQLSTLTLNSHTTQLTTTTADANTQPPPTAERRWCV